MKKEGKNTSSKILKRKKGWNLVHHGRLVKMDQGEVCYYVWGKDRMDGSDASRLEDSLMGKPGLFFPDCF